VRDLRRILVAVDFSAGSANALAHAVALARPYGALVDALHVGLPSDAPPPETLVPDARGGGSLHCAGDEAWAALEQFLGPARAAGATHLAGRIDYGDAAELILEAAGEGYDLVVMCTRARSALQRLLTGSVTERVVRGARCSVLTVPPG
jgi:nucleotide-binding universal stress UspA family protein